MNKLVFLSIFIFLLATSAYPQQDPDDPGIQDSIIVGQVTFDPVDSAVSIPIYAVTDDSVVTYQIPLGLFPRDCGVRRANPTQYFYPLTTWDEAFDSLRTDLSYFNILGQCDLDLNPDDDTVLYTNGLRVHIMTLQFKIPTEWPWQNILIDSITNEIGLYTLFGLPDAMNELSPAFLNNAITGIDSIIVEDVTVDPGAAFIDVPVRLVTSQPGFCHYYIPLTWNAPGGGITIDSVIENDWPQCNDERHDSISFAPPLIRLWGSCDNSLNTIDNPSWTIRFAISPYAPRQMLDINLAPYQQNGHPTLGGCNEYAIDEPVFKHGQINCGNITEIPDPGAQDSIIIDSLLVPWGTTSVNIQTFAVTDDSIGSYNIPLHLIQDSIEVKFGSPYYSWPLTCWSSVLDSISADSQYIDLFGVRDPDSAQCYLNTSNERRHIFTFHFVIPPENPARIVYIDSTSNDDIGPIHFGLTDNFRGFSPAFKRGVIVIDEPISIDEVSKPIIYSLSQNYPNPFNPSTQIEFALPKSGLVTLKIYDVLGRHVKRLIDENLNSGQYSIIWDGTNDNMDGMPSGAYFYKLTAGDFMLTKKMLLIR